MAERAARSVETLPGSPVVVAIDQGTSSTKVVVVDDTGTIVSSVTVALGQAHPHPGWVQQDADEIFTSVLRGLAESTIGFGDRIAAVGLSSQRESALAWDRSTGQPLGPLLGWQDRRTSGTAADLTAAGHGDLVREVTGLPIDPMFSALKFGWLLDQVDPDRSRSRAGEICLGTVDSWLLFKLTGEHRIEAGNASRTQLLNLDTVDWDDRLLTLFGVPRAALPRIDASSAASADIVGVPGLPAHTRVLAVLCDSHAALYAHGVRGPGAVKVTYGTGSSIMGLQGGAASTAGGLVRTISWQTDAVAYAFEGNILSTGATMVWLAGLLGRTPAALFELAESVTADHGLDLVPAFNGLGAPWWDENAQALIIGLGLGTGAADLARAGAESIPLQIEDVLAAADSAADNTHGARIDRILVDGGPAGNDWLMQLQADLSQRDVVRPDVAALSALGVAYLAGVQAGIWTDAAVLALPRTVTTFRPGPGADESRQRRQRWLAAVAGARGLPAYSDLSTSVIR